MTLSKYVALSSVFLFLLFNGCMSERPPDIPANAQIASSGNDRLTYTAPTDGRIWVFDTANDRIDYAGPVHANQSLVVDPKANQITIDGQVREEKTLASGAEHKIFFQPGESNP